MVGNTWKQISCILLSALIMCGGSTAMAGKKKQRPSEDSVGIWRTLPPKVTKGKNPFSLMEDTGGLQNAIRDSKGNYRFSTVGAGKHPLTIIGSPGQILQQIDKEAKAHRSIVNTVDELGNEIYIGIAPYKPRERYREIDGLHAFINQSAKELLSFMPAPELPPALDIAYDVIDGVKTIGEFIYDTVKKHDEKDSLNNTLMYLKISYLQEDGMEKIGTGEVSFEEISRIMHREYMDALRQP